MCSFFHGWLNKKTCRFCAMTIFTCRPHCVCRLALGCRCSCAKKIVIICSYISFIPEAFATSSIAFKHVCDSNATAGMVEDAIHCCVSRSVDEAISRWSKSSFYLKAWSKRDGNWAANFTSRRCRMRSYETSLSIQGDPHAHRFSLPRCGFWLFGSRHSTVWTAPILWAIPKEIQTGLRNHSSVFII